MCFCFFRLPRSLRIFNQHPHTGQGNRKLQKNAFYIFFFSFVVHGNAHKPDSDIDQLASIKLARYGEDLLFYLYYMNGGDLLQLLAAVEL